MSTIKISELPPIAHYMQTIILAAHIELWHKATIRQDLPPNAARELAIQYTTQPIDDQQKAMVENAYRVAIRLYFAMDDLGLKWDKRRLNIDHLVTLGL